MTPTKGYTEMKDSGIHWMGKIPKHWDLIRAKFHFTQTNSRGNEVPILLAASQKNGVCPQSWLEGVVQVSENTDLQQFKTVHKNDFVISLRSFQGGFERSDFEGVCSPAYQVFHADNAFDNNYLKYLFKNELFIDEMNSLTVGIREGRNIKYEDFANSLILVPPLSEQSAIAAYLDTQCAKIDEIIAQAKASIEDYKQWKASIIYEAVTKGLDPKVEMKDSGIPWIGKIPVHWAISRIKNIATNLDYLREPISAENRENKLGLYDYYGASGVIDKIDDYNVDDTVLLIGEDGANLRMRNLPLVYRASGKFWVNNHAHILKVKPGCSYGYVAYLLEAGDYNVYITGSAQPKLSQFNLMRFPIVIPDFKEQVQIEKYLDKWCLQIDTLIAEKEDFLIDLESYKKSLIYEVVTGKRRM